MKVGRHRFHIERQALRLQLIRQTGLAVALFCLQESITNGTVETAPELLANTHHGALLLPCIPAVAGEPQHTTHGFNAEFDLVFIDKDILHFRRFAKYVAAFWRMAVPRPSLPVDASGGQFQRPARFPCRKRPFAAAVCCASYRAATYTG